MKLLIHAAEEDATCCIDGHPFTIPPNQTWEVPTITGTDHNNNGPFEYTIPEDQVSRLIQAHCWAFGMVEVPVVRSQGKFGVRFEFSDEDAIREAKLALIRAEEQIVANYVKTAQDRLSQNLPAMAPNGRTLYVIQKRKIDLKKEYNIVPVGYGTVAASAANQDQIDAIRKDADARYAALEEKFNKLLTQLGEGEPAGKKK